MVFEFISLSGEKSGRALSAKVKFGSASVLIALTAVIASVAGAQTRPLNDTGITFCGAAAEGNNVACLATDPAGQDKNYGRDAAAIAGTLTKIGEIGRAHV